MKWFVITWQSQTGKVWESERCANSARAALASFRKGIASLRNRPAITVLGIAECGARLSLHVVEG